MRFSDKLGAIQDTIEAHSIVLEKRGAVWFGKIGKTLARHVVMRLNEQSASESQAFLYLIQKEIGGHQVYRGTIAKISREFPDRERKLIPKYYESSGILKYMHLWVKLSSLERRHVGELNNLIVSASGMPVLQSIYQSMAGMFIIRDLRMRH